MHTWHGLAVPLPISISAEACIEAAAQELHSKLLTIRLQPICSPDMLMLNYLYHLRLAWPNRQRAVLPSFGVTGDMRKGLLSTVCRTGNLPWEAAWAQEACVPLEESKRAMCLG